MSINGKRTGFTVADLRDVAAVAGLTRGRAQAIFAEVAAIVSGWREIADEVGVDDQMAEQSPARIASSCRDFFALPRLAPP
jgi:hypothetical protein